jgi:fucose permease
MQATLLGALLPELSKTFTPGQSGTLASVQSLGLILASLITGPVLDRAGRKAGALGGLGLIVGALTLLPHAQTYPTLLFVMSLLGLGGGVIATATNTLASDLGGNRQASMMNLLNVFFGLGGMATPALAAFLDTGALCALVVALALGTMLLYGCTPMPRRTGEREQSMPAMRGLLGRPLFPLLCLFLFLYVAAELGVWNWLAAYWTGRGVPRAVALRTLSFGFATGIITGRLAALRVLMRFRPATVTLACSVLMVVTTSLVLLASGTLMAGLAVFCAGLAMAPVYPTTLALVSEGFPRGTATAIGIAVTVGWIGVAVSSKVIGSIAGDDPGRLGVALLVIPGCAAAMVALGVTIRRLAG